MICFRPWMEKWLEPEVEQRLVSWIVGIGALQQAVGAGGDEHLPAVDFALRTHVSPPGGLLGGRFVQAFAAAGAVQRP